MSMGSQSMGGNGAPTSMGSHSMGQSANAAGPASGKYGGFGSEDIARLGYNNENKFNAPYDPYTKGQSAPSQGTFNHNNSKKNVLAADSTKAKKSKKSKKKAADSYDSESDDDEESEKDSSDESDLDSDDSEDRRKKAKKNKRKARAAKAGKVEAPPSAKPAAPQQA